jgi:DNA (cytosine-5)-methyltransferase 1
MVSYECPRCARPFPTLQKYDRHCASKSCPDNVAKLKAALLPEFTAMHAQVHGLDKSLAVLREKISLLSPVPLTNTVVWHGTPSLAPSAEKPAAGLTFIDLFCGIGGFHQALTQLGGRCVLACDIDAKCREVYEANYGLKPEVDVTKLDTATMPDFDVLCGGFPCFVAGTQVLTESGYKAIESVSLEDRLLTHTGSFQRILNLQRKIYPGELYSVDLKYHPHALKATEEHPFYVRTKVGKPSWKPIRDVTADDFFGMAINTKSDVPEFSIVKTINQRKIESESIALDTPDMWFMMGYFIGDGWIEEGAKSDGRLKHTIRFAIADKDVDTVLPRLQRVLPITTKGVTTGACEKYGCADVMWYTILKEFGKYAHGKTIPEWVQDAPKDFVEEFIAGYKAADGSTTASGGFSYTTVSHNLAFGLQRLYMKVGVIVSVRHVPMPSTCVIEGRTVNQRSFYQIRGKLHKEKEVAAFIDGDYAWMPSFRITHSPVAEPTPVYNFEVEEDNSYCVENTIVHNCQAFSHSGKQGGFEDTRGTLFRDCARILKDKQPKYFLMENVKNLRGHDEGRTWATIYRSFTEAGYTTYEHPVVLSPHQLGVPQHRERVLLMGIRNDLAPPVLPDLPPLSPPPCNIRSILMDDADIPAGTALTADDTGILDRWEEMVQHFKALGTRGVKLPTFPMWSEEWDGAYPLTDAEKTPEWKAKFLTQNREFYREHIAFLGPWLARARATPKFVGAKSKFEWQAGAFQTDDSLWRLLFQFRPSGIRVKRATYSPALVALAQIVYVGEKRRKLCPREVARLQSFPDSFKLPPAAAVAYKQFGNSVNVEVIKYAMRHILTKMAPR